RPIRPDSIPLHRTPPDDKRPARRDHGLAPSKTRFRFNGKLVVTATHGEFLLKPIPGTRLPELHDDFSATARRGLPALPRLRPGRVQHAPAQRASAGPRPPGR